MGQSVWHLFHTLLSFSCRCSYFQEVLLSGKLPTDGREIELHEDGSWSSLVIEEELTTILSPMVNIFYLGADKSLHNQEGNKLQ